MTLLSIDPPKQLRAYIKGAMQSSCPIIPLTYYYITNPNPITSTIPGDSNQPLISDAMVSFLFLKPLSLTYSSFISFLSFREP